MQLMFKFIVLLIAAILLVACSPEPTPPFVLPIAIEVSTNTPDPTATITPTQTPTATPTATPEPSPERYTTLLLGTDWDPRRPERVRFGVRTDVFIIITWLDHWRDGVTDLTIFSVPRDLWIEVPCSPLDSQLNGFDRVNSAYSYGGFDCVRETVQRNFGLEVNAPIFLVEMLGFIEIVDLFDPLIILPTQTYTDWCGDFQGTEGRGAKITWHEGQSYEMDGNFLLCYIRARRGAATGDLDRNRRALEVVNAMASQYPYQIVNDPLAAVPEALTFWGIVSEYVDSDVTASDILKFAPMVFEAMRDSVDWKSIRLTLDEVEFYTTPIYGASVLKLKIHLKEWTACMLQSGPTHVVGPVCAETYKIAMPEN
jgi:anionic cell wall polymer biosynthesis LytR-Cps2A-Psr (LCP) family protein